MRVFQPLHDCRAAERPHDRASRSDRRLRRALFFAAPWAMQHPGGGEVQLLKTAESLREAGADVRLFDPWHDRLESADWLHLFGTLPECLEMARRAKQAGTRVALSTISWYDPAANWRLEASLPRKLRGVASWTARRLFPRLPSWRRELIHAADLLLPNSQAEARQLTTLFGADPARIVVVPNGVDPRFASGDAWRFEKSFGLSNFILVPGRIEPRKNQLTLIRALAGTGLDVVILGDSHPGHAEYSDQCRAEADPSVRFIGRIEHDSPMMTAACRAARVVALASWFETPGLAALEGALAGANVVVTERGCAREYFGNAARYVQPHDVAGIRAAVREAFTSPRCDELQKRIEQQFLWRHVAGQTLAAYERAQPASRERIKPGGRGGMSGTEPMNPTNPTISGIRQPKANPVPAGSRYRYSKRRYRVLFRLIDAVGHAITRAAGAPRKLRPRRRPTPARILIVQLDHVGDAVLSTGMLRSLHERFPRAAIDILASHWNADVFRGNPAVRQVLVSERNWQARPPARAAYFSEVLNQSRLLRRFGYDVGIDPRGDFLVACTLWLAGIPRRLGWDSGGGGFLLTDVARWDGTRHEVESRRALVELLGIVRGSIRPELFPTWADSYAVRELMAALGDAPAPIIALHVAAGTAAKEWPVAHFSQLIDRLTRELRGTVILVGAANDRVRLREMTHTMPRVADWTGRMTLMQLAALFAETDLFIGGDSGPAHVAAAMGTPSVVLFSGTNRAECWRPIGDSVIVLRSPVPCSPCHLKHCPVPGHPCMAGILPSHVMEVVWSLLPSARGIGARVRAVADESPGESRRAS